MLVTLESTEAKVRKENLEYLDLRACEVPRDSGGLREQEVTLVKEEVLETREREERLV